jgi:hypothetical protein
MRRAIIVLVAVSTLAAIVLAVRRPRCEQDDIVSVLDSAESIYFVGEIHLADGGTRIYVLQTNKDEILNFVIPQALDSAEVDLGPRIALLDCGTVPLDSGSDIGQRIVEILSSNKVSVRRIDGMSLSRQPEIDRLRAELNKLQQR